MPSKQLGEQDKEIEQHVRESQNDLIEEQVVHTLGRPEGRYKVQVRPLWEDRYRVNVFIGGDAASAKIANSYFVKVDEDGNIVRSSPAITKQY